MNRPLGHSRNGSLSFRVVTDKSDIPALVELAREAHEESRFSYIPFSEEKVVKIAQVVLKQSQLNCVFLAEKNGVVVGFSYCSLGEYHIGKGVIVATLQSLCVLHSVRAGLNGGKVALGLIARNINWSRQRGAAELLVHVTSGVNISETHRFLSRIKYDIIGGSYAISL